MNKPSESDKSLGIRIPLCAVFEPQNLSWCSILPNGEGHIQILLLVYIEIDIFNFFPTFSKEKLGSGYKGNQGVNFKFAPNMSMIYSDE